MKPGYHSSVNLSEMKCIPVENIPRSTTFFIPKAGGNILISSSSVWWQLNATES